MPTYGSESGMGLPFHTRAMGDMLARPALVLQGLALRECLDFHLVVIANGQSFFPGEGHFRLTAFPNMGLGAFLTASFKGRPILIATKKYQLVGCTFTEKLLISQQVSFCMFSVEGK